MNGGRERDASRPPPDYSAAEAFFAAGFFAVFGFFAAGFFAVFGAPDFTDLVVGFFAAVFFFAAIVNLQGKSRSTMHTTFVHAFCTELPR